MRVTNKHLEAKIGIINRELGLPESSCTRDDDGKLRANIGNIHLYQAYGATGVHQMMNEGGGVVDLMGGLGTKREVMHFLNGMLANRRAQK